MLVRMDERKESEADEIVFVVRVVGLEESKELLLFSFYSFADHSWEYGILFRRRTVPRGSFARLAIVLRALGWWVVGLQKPNVWGP